MGRYNNCCVPQCKSTQNKDQVSFHRFPHNKTLLTTWIGCLKIEKKVTSTMLVCSKHFTENDFVQLEDDTYTCKHLKKESIPSLNLPQSSCAKIVNKAAAEKRRRGNRNLLKNASLPQQVETGNEVEKSLQHVGVDAETIPTGRNQTPEEKILQLENQLKIKDEKIIELGNERDHFKKLFDEGNSINYEQLKENNERLIMMASLPQQDIQQIQGTHVINPVVTDHSYSTCSVSKDNDWCMSKEEGVRKGKLRSKSSKHLNMGLFDPRPDFMKKRDPERIQKFKDHLTAIGVAFADYIDPHAEVAMTPYGEIPIHSSLYCQLQARGLL